VCTHERSYLAGSGATAWARVSQRTSCEAASAGVDP